MTLQKAIEILENTYQIYSICNDSKVGNKYFNELVEAIKIVLEELYNEKNY